jgi:hypothetical protein
MPGGEKMTGFTRILHRTVDDAVVGEVGASACCARRVWCVCKQHVCVWCALHRTVDDAVVGEVRGERVLPAACVVCVRVV